MYYDEYLVWIVFFFLKVWLFRFRIFGFGVRIIGCKRCYEGK